MQDRHTHAPDTAPPEHDLRNAIRLALIFALVKFAIHLVTNLLQPHLGWGYFRDELYYIACGRHLGFGYVDHPPLVAVQARLATMLFGMSLAGIRMFSALAGAGRVFLTGILCWRLGGRASAQALAMLTVLLVPQYLATDGYLSMNSCESFFWMLCILAVLQLVQVSRADTHMASLCWIVFGVSAGLGVENKHTMAFFLVSLLVALLITPQRMLLFTRQAAVGVAILLALAAPNLLWQMHNHWPMWEFIQNGAKEHKNIILPPADFLREQVMMLSPFSCCIWAVGLLWLLTAPRAKNLRWIGITYVVFVPLMVLLHAKDYYLAPIYPMLFAAGGVALLGVRGTAAAPAKATPRAYAIGLGCYVAFLVATDILIVPAAIPVFTPEHQLEYLVRTHLQGKPDEKWAQGKMKQFFSDRFDWQEIANGVTAAYNSLSPEDQKRVGIFGGNYGDASAINLLAPAPANGSKLPVAVSGQNSYWLWGSQGYSGDVMILAVRATPEQVREYYNDVTVFTKADSPWAMPGEQINIYICRHRKGNFAQDWPDMKEYI